MTLRALARGPLRTALAVLVGLGLGAGAGADPAPAPALVHIPGTHVSLAMPDGFELAHGFPGIGRDEDVTSVLVTELPVPLEVARAALEPDALADRGVTLHASAHVEVDGRDALLVHASQRAAGMAFRKWMLLFGNEQGSVLVTATTPREYEARYQKALVGALRSVVWRRDEEAGEPPELPFALGAPPHFDVVSRSSNAVVLTDRRRADDGPGVAPLISVGASLGRVDVGDLAAFARERLEETPSVEAVEVESERERPLGGMPAHEIRAHARDIRSRRDVRVIQLLAAREGRYYLIQAIAEPADAESTSRAYEAVAGSFRLR